MKYKEYLKYQDIDNILEKLYKELEINRNNEKKYKNLKEKISKIILLKKKNKFNNKLQEAILKGDMKK